MKILFPRPVRVDGKTIYPPDGRLACLAEEDGEFYILSQYKNGKFTERKKIDFLFEHNMLAALSEYGMTLINALIEEYKSKHEIPDWEPKGEI